MTKASTDARKQQGAFASFLKRKDIEVSFQRYAIDALAAMAQGLFASLLIGTIFNTIGNLSGLTAFNDIGAFASAMAGPAMACAIGRALKCPPLVLFSLITVGHAANTAGGAGGPLAVLVVAIIAAELGKAVSKETKVDILVTPAVTIGLGCALAILAGPWIGKGAMAVGNFIMWATELQPFFMGIIIAVVVGIALTLPISSAAICAALGLTGLAGGAALAGCCAQMVGFAVISFRDNGWGGIVSQGLGTSMLQMGTSCASPRYGSHRPWHRRSGDRSPPVCCTCSRTGRPSPRAWAPADSSARSACTPAGSRTESRPVSSNGRAWRWCASSFPPW